MCPIAISRINSSNLDGLSFSRRLLSAHLSLAILPSCQICMAAFLAHTGSSPSPLPSVLRATKEFLWLVPVSRSCPIPPSRGWSPNSPSYFILACPCDPLTPHTQDLQSRPCLPLSHAHCSVLAKVPPLAQKYSNHWAVPWDSWGNWVPLAITKNRPPSRGGAWSYLHLISHVLLTPVGDLPLSERRWRNEWMRGCIKEVREMQEERRGEKLWSVL